MNHAVRSAATDGACRVIYHAHPTNIIALSYLLPLDARTFTRRAVEGHDRVRRRVPGRCGRGAGGWCPAGADIARATSEQ